MRDLILFGLLIILLLVAQFASAKTVDEIIERYLRARGGNDKLASVKSIYMEGTKEMMGKEIKIKITKEQDKLSRTDIETGEGKYIMLITDKGACTFFPVGSTAVDKIPDEDLAALQTEMDITGPLTDYIAKGHKAELMGKDTVGDKTCYKIKVTTKAGQEMMFWVDAATYLVNQSSTTTIWASRGVDPETFTIYGNYKEVGGIQFAHTVETKTNSSNGAEICEETFFHTIMVNPTIDPKMYQPE